MKKSFVTLTVGITLLSATVPSLSGIAHAEQIAPYSQTKDANRISNTPSQDFINKFDSSINLVSGKYTIDKSKLPSDASQIELQQLENLIAEKNAIISQSEKLTDGTQVYTNNDYVAIDSSSNIMSRYRQGSNYVHVYWWGLRIGISKDTLTLAIQIGTTIGSVYVPAKAVLLALGLIGIGAGYIPGGIVFNSTPGIANIWGVEWQ